jgi:hypothetical protein
MVGLRERLRVRSAVRIDADRVGDVLKLGRAEIADLEIEPAFDLTIGILR